MKRNGFTLVELIAVLVILSIIGMLAAPNIINLMQTGKEGSFISDAEEMVSTATYMYKIQSARGFEESAFEEISQYQHRIYMKDLTGTIPESDPYGYTYDTSNSYISFEEPDDTETTETRTVKAYFKSCKKDESGSIIKCHCINATDENADATNIKNSYIVDCN